MSRLLRFLTVAGYIWCIGAVEEGTAATWYVDADAPPGGNGAAWATAFSTLQPAIDAAFAAGGGEVWVAEGLYAESRDPDTGALLLRDGVALYGGFTGSETRREQRDPQSHPVIIDASHSQEGAVGTRVLIGASKTTVDGFTLTGAIGTGLFYTQCTSVILRNCIVERNEGVGTGTIFDSTDSAGGLSASLVDDVEIESCIFRQNSSHRSGGGISLKGSNVRILNCQFEQNVAAGGGGGAELYSTGDILLEGCVFFDNTVSDGGGLLLDNGAFAVSSCAFINNSAMAGSGGAMCLNTKLARISGCLFSGNQARYGGALFEGANPTWVIDCPRNLFVSCMFAGNRADDGALIHAYGDDICEYPDEGQWSGEGEGEGEGFRYIDACSETDREKGVDGGHSAIRSNASEMRFDSGFDGSFIDVPEFYGCTIVDNTAIDSGGATLVYSMPCAEMVGYAAEARFTNCIFSGNADPLLKSYSGISLATDITYCVVPPGIGGLGNFSADPQFLDLLNGDFRLHATSPCVDTGANLSAEPSSVTTDIRGIPRPLDGDGLGAGSTGDGSDYDIGAYEHVPPNTYCGTYHAADSNEDQQIGLPELLRIVQIFNVGGYYCLDGTEDAFSPYSGVREDCCMHHADYAPPDWAIALNELLRVVQFFNSNGYQPCPGEGTEDGFCLGLE